MTRYGTRPSKRKHHAGSRAGRLDLLRDFLRGRNLDVDLVSAKTGIKYDLLQQLRTGCRQAARLPYDGELDRLAEFFGLAPAEVHEEILRAAREFYRARRGNELDRAAGRTQQE